MLIGITVMLYFFPLATNAQNNEAIYRNFPIVISIQFHNLAMPFKDLKSNFRNIGIGVGTEISLNGRQDLVQQFQIGFCRNKNIGNNFWIYTQTAYRPTVVGNFYGEIKGGLGWQRNFHPVASYKFANGAWVSSHAGKSQIIVPFGISAGYYQAQNSTFIAPFATYQVIPALFYNRSIPLNFYSAFQMGTNIYVK